VASIPVLKPPQKKMPEKKPTTSRLSKEYFALGRRIIARNPVFPLSAMKLSPYALVVSKRLQDKGACAPLSLLPIKLLDQ
jgi:hypothetical protein